MLRKIAARQLRTGMFVHKLCGSWLDHPFWKSSFLVADAQQLARITASGITDMWIDTLRGLDLPAAAPVPSDDRWLVETMLDPDPTPDTAATLQACSLGDELERAGLIVAEGRAAMQRMFRDVRLGNAIDAEHCLPLVNDITSSVDRNPGAIVSLARLKTSDDYTYMHSVAVCALMVSLARTLGLSATQTRDAGLAGLVHDLGKALMPVTILNKPGTLTEAEFAIMRTHPRAGHDLLEKTRGVGDDAMDVCLHHHEKVDGTGYPVGLKGAQISVVARMGAVCDVYDAITSNRPYKAGWDPAISVQKMAQWSRDGHFDDAILQALVKSIGIYPIGSLVRLRSQRLAVVVDQSPSSLLTPTVEVLIDAVTRRSCAPERIELAGPACSDRIVSRETAAAWELTDIDERWLAPA